ncbi:MAG TPA: MFS transporter [Acidimicrobiales bacterium]|nr:MFS transporter [Acidimicrobiales bacterium]
MLALAVVALAAGFGQFGAVATLGDVARGFGHAVHGDTIAEQAGLSATEVGLGLAVLRLASLGALRVAGAADRVGRRRVLLGATAFGLVVTILAAASPGYWWFVVILAAGRPALSAAVSVAQVAAVEETGTRDRAKAVALLAAAYAAGSGITVVLHSLAKGVLGFRGIFALAIVPLLLLWWVRGRVSETGRFSQMGGEHAAPVLGPVARPYRRRLAVVAGLAFAVAVVAGPANSFLFLYAQNVRHLVGWETAVMVVVAGGAGFGGLVAGRWLADHIGRRPTAGIGLVLIALAATLTYSGSTPALLLGYVAGVTTGSIFAPAAGALSNELFPTAVRASVGGWTVAAGVLGATAGLLLFGAVADVGNRFSVAALATFLPVIPAALLFRLVPETRGREPEELWE